MQQSTTGNDIFDGTALLMRLWRWRIVLGIVALVSFGATFLVVKLIEPLYESHAILYPTLSTNREKQLEEFAYGFDVHSERLMQMLASDAILDSLNARYDLVGHYKIDRDHRAWYDHFMRKAHDRIQFHKTRYTSVVISVVDEDPELAAQLANDVSQLVNDVNAQIVKSNAKAAMDAVEHEYQKRLGMVRATDDSIFHMVEGAAGIAERQLERQIAEKRATILRLRTELGDIRQKFNIYDIANQIHVLNEQLAVAKSNFLQESGRLEIFEENKPSVPDSLIVSARAARKGAENRVKQFEKQLEALSKTSSRYTALNSMLQEENDLLQETLHKLETLRNSVEPQVATRRLESMEREYDWEQIQTQELKRKYQQALSNYLDPAPAAYLISKARPAYIKIYPKLGFSLLVVTLGSTLMAFVVLMFWERIRGGVGQ